MCLYPMSDSSKTRFVHSNRIARPFLLTVRFDFMMELGAAMTFCPLDIRSSSGASDGTTLPEWRNASSSVPSKTRTALFLRVRELPVFLLCISFDALPVRTAVRGPSFEPLDCCVVGTSVLVPAPALFDGWALTSTGVISSSS